MGKMEEVFSRGEDREQREDRMGREGGKYLRDALPLYLDHSSLMQTMSLPCCSTA